MKRFLNILIVALYAIVFSGCYKNNPNEPLQSHAAPSKPANMVSSTNQSMDITGDPVSIQDIKLVKKAAKAKYLLTNGIKIKFNNIPLNTEKGEIYIMLPQIQGLADKAIEERLNKNIQRDIEAEVKNYFAEIDGEQAFAGCVVDLNENNLLSISIRGYYTPPVYGFLYRLTDGERLFLKDIFTEGTDYVSLLNRKVIEGIANGEISEEYLLREPFKTIDSNQNFSLSATTLYIVFHKGEGGFEQRNSVSIPLLSIDDYVDVIDRYSGTERKTQLISDSFIKRNNIFVTFKGEIYKRTNGNLWIHYPEISGLRNPEFEKKINASIKNSIAELKDSSLFNNLVKGEEYGKDCIALIELIVSFNHYGILSIERNVNTFTPDKTFEDLHRVYSFDLTKSKAIDAKTIVTDYLSKNKGYEETFVKTIRENLNLQFVSKNIKINDASDYIIDYAFIKKNGTFYFTKSYAEDELLIHVSFLGSSTNGTALRADCTIPLKSILTGDPDDFFQ
jgi:hypothetical protein